MFRRGSVIWLEFVVGVYNLLVGSKMLRATGTMRLDSYGAFEGPAWLWGGLQVGVALAVWHAALTAGREWRAAMLVLAAVVSWSRAYFFHLGAPSSTGVEATLALGLFAAIGAALHVWRFYDEHDRARRRPPPHPTPDPMRLAQYVDQPGRAPTRKVTSAATLGTAVAVVAAWLAGALGAEMSPEVAAAVASLITAAVAHLTRDRAADGPAGP